jgi:hypothetical protein
MNRQEAADFLKELLDTFCSLEGKPFALMPPDSDSVLSKGYQIHIKTTLDESTLLGIRKIVLERNLAISEEDNLTVIYKPIKKGLAN